MDLKFEAILFDLDGTLIDSSVVIIRAWSALAAKHGKDINKIFAEIQGKPAEESISALCPEASAHELRRDTQWLEEMESNDTEGVIALPGSVDLLNQLNHEQIPWAIVTSGTLPVASARIKAAGLPSPQVLITPEQVSQGKPDPAPYILGAAKLGVDIGQCIVFEDAPAGVKSGVAAGASVIGVLTQFDTTALRAEKARGCIDTLQEITLTTDKGKHLIKITGKDV